MPQWLMLALFFFIVVVSHVLEGITGFGSTALSIPFLSVMLGLAVAKPLLMLYTLFLCVYVLARSYRQIAWRSLGVMLGVAALGLPIGLVLYNRLPKALLMGLLGVFMVAVSVRGLLLSFGILKPKRKPSDAVLIPALFAGGIIQGAFASGGPLVILYATEKITDKSRFRATMCMFWLVLDIVLLSQMGFAGQLSPELWQTALWGAPFLVLGTVLGDIAHKKVSDTLFLRLTYAILLLSGIFTLINL